MRIGVKSIFKTHGEIESKFGKVIGQYDSYINRLENDIRIWRAIGALSLLVFLISVTGWFIVAFQKKEHLMVVEVNELGRAVYRGNVLSGAFSREYQVKDYQVEAILRDFIEFTRVIGTDPEMMDNGYQRVFLSCSYEMAQKLSGELVADDPFSQVGRLRRKTSIESGIKITGSTWQYDWFDIYENMLGQATSRTRYRGLFTVIIQDPKSEAERFNNPLGIYIVDYNITRLDEVTR